MYQETSTCKKISEHIVFLTAWLKLLTQFFKTGGVHIFLSNSAFLFDLSVFNTRVRFE